MGQRFGLGHYGGRLMSRDRGLSDLLSSVEAGSSHNWTSMGGGSAGR